MYERILCIHTYDISGDPSKPRSWSKYASDSSYNKTNEASDAKTKEKAINLSGKEDIEETKIKSDKKKKKKNKADKKEKDEVKKVLEKV